MLDWRWICPCSGAHLRSSEFPGVSRSGAFSFESHRDQKNAHVGDDEANIEDEGISY